MGFLSSTIRWSESRGSVVWKHPDHSIRNKSVLQVEPGQAAAFVVSGKVVAVFKQGRHTLATSNNALTAPIREAIAGSRHDAQIWFVAENTRFDMKWGTADPFQLMDPKFQILLPVRAHGQASYGVSDVSCFLESMGWRNDSLSTSELQSYTRGLFLASAKSFISHTIVELGTSFFEVNSILPQLSANISQAISSELAAFGLNVYSFTLNSVGVNQADPSVVAIREALASRSASNILNTNYQEQQSFEILKQAARRPTVGEDGGGIGAAFAAGYSNASRHFSMPSSNEKSPLCDSCGEDLSLGAKFCPACGAGQTSQSKIQQSPMVIHCDKCQAEIPTEASFCPACGDPVIRCSGCGTDIPEICSKCPNCGTLRA